MENDVYDKVLCIDGVFFNVVIKEHEVEKGVMSKRDRDLLIDLKHVIAKYLED